MRFPRRPYRNSAQNARRHAAPLCSFATCLGPAHFRRAARHGAGAANGDGGHRFQRGKCRHLGRPLSLFLSFEFRDDECHGQCECGVRKWLRCCMGGLSPLKSRLSIHGRRCMCGANLDAASCEAKTSGLRAPVKFEHVTLVATQTQKCHLAEPKFAQTET